MRRRSRPRSSSGTGVVAASTTVAATPSVPLTRMFQARPQPGTDSDRPSTSTRAPRPTNGRKQREREERQLDDAAAGRRAPSGSPASAATASDQRGVDAERPERLAGRGRRRRRRTATVAASLHSRREAGGRRGCRRARRAVGGAVTGPPRSARPAARWRRASRAGAPHDAGRGPPPMRERDGDADDAGEAGGQPLVVDALDGVAGERAVGRGRGRFSGRVEALVDGDLLQAVRARAGVRARRRTASTSATSEPGDDERPRRDAARFTSAPPPSTAAGPRRRERRQRGRGRRRPGRDARPAPRRRSAR